MVERAPGRIPYHLTLRPKTVGRMFENGSPETPPLRRGPSLVSLFGSWMRTQDPPAASAESNLMSRHSRPNNSYLIFSNLPTVCHKRKVFSAPSLWCVALVGMRRAYPFTLILPEKVMQTSKLRLCALIVASILPGLLLSACGSSDSPSQSACGGASVSAKMSCPPAATPASSS